MKKSFLKFLSVAVITIGLLNCGGPSNPLIKEAQDGIKAGNYEAALASLDQAIVEDSVDADAYYYKGIVYSEIAQNNPDIAERKNSYRNMRENLVKANTLYTNQGAKSVESVQSQLLIDKIWGQEHNNGVKYAQGDTTVAQVANPLETSIAHLQNAVIINPDSTLSYQVLAEVHRLNGSPEKSAEVYETVLEIKPNPDASDYDRLGSLYLQSEQYQKAITSLNKGTEAFPDSVSLVQKLADAYMNAGENEESIKVIESLIARDPENPQYHLVLGTQIYIMASKMNDKVSENYDEIFELEREIRSLSGAEKSTAENKLKNLKSEIDDLSSKSNNLTDQAIEEIKLVTELKPNDANAFNTLGVIYQNRAAGLFEKRNATEDNDEAAKIDDEAKNNLRQAMTNYEKATEIQPDNQNYWRSLFQVYTSLGMNEKAEEAMEKAGM